MSMQQVKLMAAEANTAKPPGILKRLKARLPDSLRAAMILTPYLWLLLFFLSYRC